MKCRQLALEERALIAHLSKQGMNLAEIGRQMGRHRSTIGRDLTRNTCHGYDSSYRMIIGKLKDRTTRSLNLKCIQLL